MISKQQLLVLSDRIRDLIKNTPEKACEYELIKEAHRKLALASECPDPGYEKEVETYLEAASKLAVFAEQIIKLGTKHPLLVRYEKLQLDSHEAHEGGHGPIWYGPMSLYEIEDQSIEEIGYGWEPESAEQLMTEILDEYERQDHGYRVGDIVIEEKPEPQI